MRRSQRPYGIYYLSKLMTKIPFFIYLLLSNDTTEKMTMLFSNVAGPKTPIIYEGMECRKMAFLLPSLGKISCGLSLLSIGNCMKIGLLTDKHICEEPQVFVDLLESILREEVERDNQEEVARQIAE